MSNKIINDVNNLVNIELDSREIKIINNRDIRYKQFDDNLPEYLYTHKKQMDIIKSLFMQFKIDYTDIFDREIKKKINGYKNQDKKKNKLDDNLIKMDDVIEKLLLSKLKCYYCNQDIFIIYKQHRENEQWTLDRIDNNIGHTSENTVISCLKCNIQRRTTDFDKFIFTKNIIIKKVC